MNRVISPEASGGEQYDRALRPQTLSEFVGQGAAKGNLKVFIDAARARGEALKKTAYGRAILSAVDGL